MERERNRRHRDVHGRVRHALAAHPWRVGVGLFAVALALRVVLSFSAHFLGDEVGLWRDALAIVEQGARPLLGPPITSGTARLPGPLFDYLMALPLIVCRAPEAANVWIAILGSLSVVLVWDGLRRPFGEAPALFAALLVACLPWSALYADRIWNANVTTFFVATAFWAACRLRARPTAFAVCVLLGSAAALPQLHLSAPMIWVALLPLVIPTVRRWKMRWVLLGLSIVFLLYVPMMLHEGRTHAANLRAFLRESAHNDSADYLRVPLWAFRLLSLDVTYHQLESDRMPHSEHDMLAFLFHGNTDFRYGAARASALVLSVVLALLALVTSVRAAFRRGPRAFLWAGLAGLTANVALLGVLHKGIYGHYVQPLLPFYAVAFAELGRVSFRSRRMGSLVMVLGALVAIGGVDASLWVSRQIDARSGLYTMRRVIAAIRTDSPDASHASLRLGFPGDVASYRALMQGGSPVLDDRGPRYLLLVERDSPPPGAREMARTGPVTLYRLP